MNLLISNDDGYNSIGIKKLAKRLAKDHNVVIVAPMGERSGSSHAVNFFSAVTYEDKGVIDGIRTFAVSGSPGDSVLFGIKYLYQDVKFDAVISGINTNMNAGSDIIFSGTFGAAQEGTFHGIPGIAVSVRSQGTDEYEFTADFLARNLEKLMSFATDRVTINVNVPNTKAENIKGVKIAGVSFNPYDEQYVKHIDENGKEYFIVDGHPRKQYTEGDCYWLQQGYITITPVQMLATDKDTLKELDSAQFSL